MREILFRAKHIHATKKNEHLNGRWIYGYLSDENHINSPELEGEFLIDPDTICQYTGLTDKNCIDIWENDICIIKNGGLDEEDGYFVCKWDDETARYILDGDGLFVDFDNVDTLDVEVIGNIFDNADLLNWMVIE